MADPVRDIIGDCRAFAAQQCDCLPPRGIDIRPLSHLAVRVPECDRTSSRRVTAASSRATVNSSVRVDDWIPQGLVTATGANPLPR